MTSLSPTNEQLIYQSGNGDSWFLTRDPTTGAEAVRHVPNPQSGGQASTIEPEQFLAEGANGPEHQALRQLMATSVPLATLLIAYDIHPQRGPAYDGVVAAIRSLGAWWHHLETVWIVQCDEAPAEIRDRLKPLLGFEDQLLVIDISGDTAGWIGVNDIGSKWLEENI